MNWDNQKAHPDLIGRILFFAVPYVFLLIVSFFFHRKSVDAQFKFPIYPLPSRLAQDFIYFIVVAFLGAVGIYACVGDLLDTYSWILFAVGCLLLALYVFLYQFENGCTLLLTTIAAFALAVDLEWLFIETASMKDGTGDLIVRNFIGAVGAWGLIYFLITLGQFLVYTIGINKTFQAIAFFISAILITFLIAFWNKNSYA